MLHSKNYTTIRGYYSNGLWTIDQVWNVVDNPLGITQTEYQQITGFVYPEKTGV